MTKKRNGSAEAPLVRAATELAATMESLERMTSRCAKNELATRNEILRAGEDLSRAAQSHRDFLAHLGALTQEVGRLRDRQNASAAQLSEQAQRVDQRRQDYEALEQRFGALGEGAREIGELMKAAPADEEGADAMKARLASAKGRLSESVEAACALGHDAKTAGFTELEAQAHAIRQQLQALLRKIEDVT